MARFEFKLPDIGEGVVEGEIISWLVSVGDTVTEDQPLVEVMTDKATVEIPSPRAGKILELRGNEGDLAKVHEVLVVLDTDGAGAQAEPASQPEPSQPEPPAPAPQPRSQPAAQPAVQAQPRTSPPPTTPPPMPAPSQGGGNGRMRVLATPATRRLARELGVDLTTVRGSGPAGRVTSNDVRQQANGGSTHTATAPTQQTRTTPAPQPIPRAPGEAETRVPVRGLRRAIAKQMRASEDYTVPFTFVEECDVTDLVALRKRINATQAESGGVKLTFLPFIMKAIVAGMKKFPKMNASYDQQSQEIVIKNYYNFGIGVATDAGLTVVVVQDVDSKSIIQLQQDLAELSDRARAGKSKPADVSGSTFTITSLGRDGGILATPVINYPELAILGIHKIKQQPVVRDGEIVIRDMMNISCSFDHQIIDGHEGAAFTYEVIKYIQDPNLLFIQMV